MTEPSETRRLTADDQRLVLVEAFIDGERVDPQALRDALADTEARNHFVDLLLIRDGMEAMPSKASNVVPMAPVAQRTPIRRLAAVAAMVSVSLVVGYAAGQRVMASSATPSTVEAMLPMDYSAQAPAATRSIEFAPGVNWIESSGEKQP
jgi:hypothetical protein